MSKISGERLIGMALKRRISNGWVHRHHKNCIHNLPPDEQIEMRGHAVDWWMRVIGSMPVQITPEDWQGEPLFAEEPTQIIP